MEAEKLFRGMARLILYGGVTLAILGVTVPRYRGFHTSPAGYCRLGVFAIGVLVIGVSLLKLKRWAAVAASLCLVYPAYVSAWGAYSFWLGYVLALLLLLPACMTVLYWRSAIWKGSRVGDGSRSSR